MTERRLQSAVAQYLDAVLTPETFATCIPGGDGGVTTAPGYKPGTPDYLIVHRGWAHFIELKNEKGRASKKQGACWEAISRTGAPCVVARSVDDIAHWLATWRIPTRGKLT